MEKPMKGLGGNPGPFYLNLVMPSFKLTTIQQKENLAGIEDHVVYLKI